MNSRFSKRANGTGLTGNPVIDEAIARFNRGSEWESTARLNFMEDYKFFLGDSHNAYQWPNLIRSARNGEQKPCLTINLIKPHNQQISNDMRQNKSSVRFTGQGNGATQEAANVIKDIMRRIEDQSAGQTVYKVGREFAINAGWGYWRIYTDYAGEDTFDQEIFLAPVNDPLRVVLDSSRQNITGRDSNWGFLFDTMPNDELYDAYPNLDYQLGDSPLGVGIGSEASLPKDHIMVCEYFRRVPKLDTLVSFVSDRKRHQVRRSLLPDDVWKALKNDPMTKTRLVQGNEIEWMLIAGETIVDSTIWPGKYIPIVMCAGDYSVVDGVMDLKSHTRSMIDSQRMFNYNASAQVEFVALQGKTPWVGPAKAIEEHESLWNTANRVNHSYLPYNHVDDEGNEIPPPQRAQPPASSPAYSEGMAAAFQQMSMSSGQYQQNLGEQGNERTGAAIRGTQKKGETSTFNFVDNYEEALMYTGEIILDILPKIYDTDRIFKILGDDGQSMEVRIDPHAQQAYRQQLDSDGRVIAKILNPAIGTYGVSPSVGPSYGSKREDTRDALTLILTQAPQLTSIIGDLLLSAMDFEKAEEAAQRLRNMLPPQALGGGPSPQMQELQKQIQALGASLTKSLEAEAISKVKLVGKEQMRDIDVYEAETKRMGVMKDMLPTDAAGLKQLIEQLVKDAMGVHLNDVTVANRDDLDVDSSSPVNPGAFDPMMPAGGHPGSAPAAPEGV